LRHLPDEEDAVVSRVEIQEKEGLRCQWQFHRWESRRIVDSFWML
jgi:hypothetical protein